MPYQVSYDPSAQLTSYYRKRLDEAEDCLAKGDRATTRDTCLELRLKADIVSRYCTIDVQRSNPDLRAMTRSDIKNITCTNN